MVSTGLIAGALLTTTGCRTDSEADEAKQPLESVTQAAPGEPACQPPAYLVHPPADPKQATEQLPDGALDGSARDRVTTILKTMGVSVASQVMVFSRTSHQIDLIQPRRPRAIFFSDDAYVGWVPGGFLEYSQAMPELGTGYWLVNLDESKPHFTTDKNDACLRCHGHTDPRGGPGLMVRSQLVDSKGNKLPSFPDLFVDHSTPFEERWGGWYVTGSHGSTPHLGNIFTDVLIQSVDEVDREALSNLTELKSFFAGAAYPHGGKSDIVALMVLEHQLMAHNALTQANIDFKKNLKRFEDVQTALGEPLDYRKSESLTRFLASESDRIVGILLFKDEARLPPEGIDGDPEFQQAFAANRQPDHRGHSLKDFDLKQHLFRYRCSYTIYSRAFRLMADPLKAAVCQRLMAALTTPDDPLSTHLPGEERQIITDILGETASNYPWQ